LIAAGLFALPLHAQQKTEDLTGKSLEDLMNVQVTSVSQKEQKLSRTASAIFVISQEDIRRSGATNVPDLLRMVPGLDVAQINASTWAISARGLNDEFANELLVLVDGRNVYTPTFGGVFWDLLDLPLEDIARIEVIRGPGGTVWGVNAVNGVINIITKKASETKGAMLVAGGGNVNEEFGTAQYGGELHKGTDYRVYTKYSNENDLPQLSGQEGKDAWYLLQGGFRVDSQLSSKDTLTLQGNLFKERAGDFIQYLPSVTSANLVDATTTANHSSGYLQGAWSHSYSSRSETTLDVSLEHYSIEDVFNTLNDNRWTLAVDFRHHFAWGERQDIVWGLGYLYTQDHSPGDSTTSLDPASLGTQQFSSFVQDEITVVPERTYLTVGSKLVHDYYTGFVLLPSARVAYLLNDRNTLWAAVSKAARTPDRLDTALRINTGNAAAPGSTPILTSLFGNPNYQNENLLAYEAGYRTGLSNHLSFDASAYYNDYSNQQTTEPSALFFETSPAPAHFVMPSIYKNRGYGETHGLEVSLNCKPIERWTMGAAYDFERMHFHDGAGSLDTQSGLETEGSDPHVHAKLRSHLDLSKALSWDLSAYFTDRLVYQGVPSYTRLDSGVSWSLGKGLSFSLVGQNLLRDHHVEFLESGQGLDVTQVKRSGYAKLTWYFP
jgi:iron complex outermembrane receptor protein